MTTISRRGLLAGCAGLLLPWQGRGKKKGHHKMNGLLNGLKLYAKFIDAEFELGPGPWISPYNPDGNPELTYGAGPVSGEGHIIWPAGATRAINTSALSADLAIGEQDWLLSCWFTGNLSPLSPIGEGWYPFPGFDPVPESTDGADLATIQLPSGNCYGEIPGPDDEYSGFLTRAFLGTTGPVHCLFWYTTTDKKLHLTFNPGGVSLEVVTIGMGEATPNWLQIQPDSADPPAEATIGSYGIWIGTIPDAAGRAALYNSGAGLPYSQFDDGSGGGGEGGDKGLLWWHEQERLRKQRITR